MYFDTIVAAAFIRYLPENHFRINMSDENAKFLTIYA